jgi:hypothetical protein
MRARRRNAANNIACASRVLGKEEKAEGEKLDMSPAPMRMTEPRILFF